MTSSGNPTGPAEGLAPYTIGGEVRGLGQPFIVGSSNALRNVLHLAEHVAKSRTNTVLLVGETGTGKELFARGIHHAGRFPSEPFVPINCAAIPDTLLESELFGHEKGAFTDARSQKRGLMELAGRGTLFLDEVGELPLHLQPKLLRVLEERKCRRLGGTEEVMIRARIVAGTNVALEKAVTEGTFREDVFYRLNGVRIDIPPLRERSSDIEALAKHFLKELGDTNEAVPLTLSSDALQALCAHRWPGNVRELKNVLERAALLCDGPSIEVRHLVIQRRTSVAVTAGSNIVGTIQIPSEGKSLEEITREAIQHTLLLTRGNLSATARVLGISRPTLARKLREAGLPRNGS
jgi:transcriptional regulator with PAS, ATPase and Fis domain